MSEKQNVYTFHRSEGFYPLELQDDTTALANALNNPGTLKVVNEVTGKTVFVAPGSSEAMDDVLIESIEELFNARKHIRQKDYEEAATIFRRLSFLTDKMQEWCDQQPTP